LVTPKMGKRGGSGGHHEKLLKKLPQAAIRVTLRQREGGQADEPAQGKERNWARKKTKSEILLGGGSREYGAL